MKEAALTAVAPSAAQSAKKAGTKRVAWVLMKDSANLKAAAGAKGWKARGNAVHQALTQKAQTSQAAVRSYLSQRGA